MKKVILVLLISIGFLQKNKAQNELTNQKFEIVVSNIETMGKYNKLVTEAVSLINDIFNSSEFKQKISEKKFDWENLNGGHSKMTNSEVFEKIARWTAKDSIKLYIKPRGLRVTAYYYGTIGVTSLNSNSTKTYRHWIDLSDKNYEKTLFKYVSHIAHEYCHQRGFTDKDNKPQCTFRDVVPYAIGDIVCEILNKRFNKNIECNKCSK